MEKELKVRALQFLSGSIARWVYVPIDTKGRISVGNQIWSISKTPPYQLITKYKRTTSREPFFIIRHDLATPVNVQVDKQSTNPVELNQLIHNENLKALTKLEAPVSDKRKWVIFAFMMFGFGFILSMVLGAMGYL